MRRTAAALAKDLAAGRGRRRRRRARLGRRHRLPDIWAQNIKDITLVHIGGSFSAIKEIGDQATKDLGFKIEMQAVDPATQLNRSLTQPKSIDINNIDSSTIVLPGRQGRAAADPGQRIQAVGQDRADLHDGQVPGRQADRPRRASRR